MAYVYKHIRNDTNEVFYIGIGKKKSRIYATQNRNKYWINIVNKVGYTVEIVEDGLSWEDACKKEKQLIKEYGRSDLGFGTLVNMTDGGEGFSSKHSKEAKEKMSKSHSGKKRAPLSNDTKEKIRKRITGISRSFSTIEKIRKSKLGTRHSDETRLKMSIKRKGKTHSEEVIQKLKKQKSKKHCENISKSRLGMKFSQKHIENLSKAHIGIKSWNKGGTLSNHTKEKISKTLLGNTNAKTVSVFQYDLDGNFIKKWDKMSDIKKEIKMNISNISSCIKGKRKTCYGFIWKSE